MLSRLFNPLTSFGGGGATGGSLEMCPNFANVCCCLVPVEDFAATDGDTSLMNSTFDFSFEVDSSTILFTKSSSTDLARAMISFLCSSVSLLLNFLAFTPKLASF